MIKITDLITGIVIILIIMIAIHFIIKKHDENVQEKTTTEINNKTIRTNAIIKNENEKTNKHIDNSSDAELNSMFNAIPETKDSGETLVPTGMDRASYDQTGQSTYPDAYEQSTEESFTEEQTKQTNVPKTLCKEIVWDTTLGWVYNVNCMENN